ncbi:MAG: hypothetical protein KatS3mg032_1563 [Cyclobacteriaceae bacterium]|nr:MAG: hypothetical protein KatS3mg032_1563 [Cyclobacteriaceae bacterium]
MGYPDPIQPNKQATDEAFNKALAFCLDNKQRIALVCGSHKRVQQLLPNRAHGKTRTITAG